ncbi:vexin [Spea bombifrons]|uniref:vexin n=1 Tax=Spea bombifrons TaxID=233779 RepID=UPI00234BEBF9|nr:vexin [Spea bombifrons]
MNRAPSTCDRYPRWAHKRLQADFVNDACTSDELWGILAHQSIAKPSGNSEKKTKSSKWKNKKEMRATKKSSSATSAHRSAKQIATTVPDSHVTSVTVGCSKHRPHSMVDELVFENEATLPLTGSTSRKKAPGLLQKMGLKLKKTVEYIGASNCAFEED